MGCLHKPKAKTITLPICTIHVASAGSGDQNLSFLRQGMIVTLRLGKTDQEGRIRKIGSPFVRTKHCPFKAIENWLLRAGLSQGQFYCPISKGGHRRPKGFPPLETTGKPLLTKSYHVSGNLGRKPTQRETGDTLVFGVGVSGLVHDPDGRVTLDASVDD